jgi:hypothetical protein
MTTPAPETPRSAYATHYPVMLLAVVTLLGWMACALWLRLLLTLGITDFGQWYLDSYAVLAANDAVRLGMDPNGANPLDPFLRNHKYSDWWFALRWLGLTRESNFLVGTVWVGAFALTVWRTAKPRNFRETWWLAALLLSPPVLLAVVRANNDLVIFVLLAASGVAAVGATWGRQLLAIGALVIATGLKFYPAPAALACLWIRPVRRMPLVLLGAVLATGLTLASVWPQVVRGQFTVESGLHTFGAPLLGRDLGWSDRWAMAASLFGLALAAMGLRWGRLTVGLASQDGLKERLLAALGMIVLLACFSAGVSYAYRWIFALWMALWLWRRAGGRTETPRALWTARLGCGLLLFCFWCDGGLCLVVNLLLPPLTQARADALQFTWRLWTQPAHWLLMMLFAGWLLEAAVVILKEWWAERAA